MGGLLLFLLVDCGGVRGLVLILLVDCKNKDNVFESLFRS